MFFSYKQALDMLANEEVLAPVYYILGGTKSGEVSNTDVYYFFHILVLVLLFGPIIPGGGGGGT